MLFFFLLLLSSPTVSSPFLCWNLGKDHHSIRRRKRQGRSHTLSSPFAFSIHSTNRLGTFFLLLSTEKTLESGDFFLCRLHRRRWCRCDESNWSGNDIRSLSMKWWRRNLRWGMSLLSNEGEKRSPVGVVPPPSLDQSSGMDRMTNFRWSERKAIGKCFSSLDDDRSNGGGGGIVRGKKKRHKRLCVSQLGLWEKFSKDKWEDCFSPEELFKSIRRRMRETRNEGGKSPSPWVSRASVKD